MDRPDRHLTARRTRLAATALAEAILGVTALAAACGAAVPPAARPAPVIAVLCYHDLAPDPTTPTYTIAPESLRAHIRRAKANGWAFLPLSTVIDRRDHPEKLPPRTMVLTFDDGYRSFLEQALPILREEKVKATLSVITSFVDRPPAGLPPLLGWDEIRKLDRSGLVEIASHSHDQHRYLPSNPYRDTAPAVTTRQYFADERRYETRAEYELRVAADLRESHRRLREGLGHDVSVLAWPYGEWNATARRLAAEAGFAVTLGLEGTAVAPESLAAGYLPRVMVYRENAIGAADPAWLLAPPRPVRAAQVDLDDVFDPDSATVDARVGRVIARLRALGATHVFLQGLPDPAGDGFLADAYFMNHQIPVHADIWSMVANRLARAGLVVWVRAPSMNLSWAWAQHPEWRVISRVDPEGRRPAPWYYRISPDVADARRAAVDFYADLAVYLPIRGVLFDDDAYLRADEALRGSGARDAPAKRDAIRGLLAEIEAAVRAWRPQCRFGRVLYPAVASRPGVDPDFSQDLAECASDEDLAVVSAAPFDSAARANPEAWAAARAERAVEVAGNGASGGSAGAGRAARSRAPVLLRFEAYDAIAGEWLPAATLEALIRGAERGGVRDVGLVRVTPVGGDLPDGLLRLPASLPR